MYDYVGIVYVAGLYINCVIRLSFIFVVPFLTSRQSYFRLYLKARIFLNKRKLF